MSNYLRYTVVGLLAIAFLSCTGKSDPWIGKDAVLKQIVEPKFADRTFSIEDFGAKKGVTFNSGTAINKAIDSCSKAGGGKVIVPAGVFFTGPIVLKSNVNLYISEGATLRFSTNPKDYTPFVLTRWEGIDCYNYKPLIYAYGETNIAITGKGVLDGMAGNDSWWPWKGREEYGWKKGMMSQEHNTATGGKKRLVAMMENQVPIKDRMMAESDMLRPQFINFYKCDTVLIEGVKIERSPFWLIHPLLCSNVIVRNIIAESDGPNNDGCDPESCKNVLIEGCYFNTGDDCIAIKSGRNFDGRAWDTPSENLVIRGCTMKNGHGGIVIGSEVSGGCRNVYAEDCIMDSPLLDRVVRIKTNTLRGGVVENVYVRNIKVGECAEAVLRIEMNYEMGKSRQGEFYPLVRNIYLENITSKRSKYGVYIDGYKDRIRVENINLKNCRFSNVSKGNSIVGVKNVKFENLLINNKPVN